MFSSIYRSSVYLWLLFGLKIDFICLAWVALPPAAIAATLSGILSFPIMTNFHNSNGHNNPFYIEYKNPITFDASLWRQIKMVGVARSGSLCVTQHGCFSCSSCSSFIVVCLSVCLSFTLPIRLFRPIEAL